MSYIFIKTIDDGYDKSKITFESPNNDLSVDDMVDIFTDFLRASGFQVETGEIKYEMRMNDSQN